MEIVIAEKDGIAIINLPGDFSLNNSGRLEAVIKQLVEEEKYRIIVNLENVTSIEAAVIGVFVKWMKILWEQHGDLKLFKVSETIHDVLKLAGLHSFFEIYESEEESIAAFR